MKDEKWELGKHPAMTDGYIVKPVLFGSRVEILPPHEGGHVVMLDKEDATLISLAKEMYSVIEDIVYKADVDDILDRSHDIVERATGILRAKE